MYKPLLLLLCFIIHYQLSGQIFPQENSKLNYRLIGFSFPSVHHNQLILEIAAGNYNNEDSFKKHMILSQSVDKNRIIAEVPFFGKQYTWRVINTRDNSASTAKAMHHFSTGIIPSVDTSLYHIRVTIPARQYKDAFVFNDYLGILYNMAGQPVWYLPITDTMGNTYARDIKCSPLGTITYIHGSDISEIDYNGNILWQKTRDSIDKGLFKTNYPYHHEFTRLSNGNYMALGTEVLSCKMPSQADSSIVIVGDENIKNDGNSPYRNIAFETLVEYDKKGKVVWLWRASDYFVKSDLIYSKAITGNLDMHCNSFFFDEQNKIVYLSFRNISRVIRVKYPDGNVVNSYGKSFSKAAQVFPVFADNGNEFFCGEHACRLAQNGYLYLFDNECDTNLPPKVIMMQQPSAPDGKPEIKWQYEFADIDRHYAGGGGNVMELPDRSLFASLGSGSGKVYIISIGKEILWSNTCERWDKNLRKWVMLPSYRSSIITDRKQLEELIWNSEKEQHAN